MTFQDHFSDQAAAYARYRPRYPAALFDYLATLTPSHGCAWDAGTGNGQAAHGLARHFERVIATDASAAQLARAAPHPRITYRAEPAERTSLDAGTVDLITVAQALHWFDHNRFFTEVRRVARPAGVVTAWAYDLCRVSPAVDAVVRRYYSEVVGPYWPPERSFFERGYAVPFPFARLGTPTFALEEVWDLDAFRGYLGTWSATQRYRRATGREPLDVIRNVLEAAWGDPTVPRRIRWPLWLLVGRVDAPA